MGNFFGLFFGSIFGTIFLVFIAVLILLGIVKLFRISMSQEDWEGCFTIIGWIALVITFVVFICNKCSTAG